MRAVASANLPSRVRRVASIIPVFMRCPFTGVPQAATWAATGRSGFRRDLWRREPYLIRSASARFTASLAWNAPSTLMLSIVAKASSGETSSAILAKPKTLICSRCPAARTASKSWRVYCCSPSTSVLRADSLPDGLGMGGQLVADGGTDEVGAIRVETLLHQQINLPQINGAQVHRDLLCLACHDRLLTIHLPSIYHPIGWYNSKGRAHSQENFLSPCVTACRPSRLSRSTSRTYFALRLTVTEGTVKVHLHNIYTKLGVDGRMELLKYAQEHGLA